MLMSAGVDAYVVVVDALPFGLQFNDSWQALLSRYPLHRLWGPLAKAIINPDVFLRPRQRSETLTVSSGLKVYYGLACP